MPIRELRCRSCRRVFETLVLSRRDEARQRCPDCGSSKLEMLFSVFGVAGAEKKVTSSGKCASCSTHNCSTCG